MNDVLDVHVIDAIQYLVNDVSRFILSETFHFVKSIQKLTSPTNFRLDIEVTIIEENGLA